MKQFWGKIFSKKKKEPTPADVKTAPLSEEQLKSVTVEQLKHSPPQLLVGSAQSVGKQRDHNEDTLFTLNSLISDDSTQLPFGIFIIADGMGGHQHGEIASQIAVRAMNEQIVSKLFFSLMGIRDGDQGESMQEILEEGVRNAQQLVVKKAPGGGTTLTVALVIGEQVTLAHVGDSRAYFIYPDGRMVAMTQDHSLVHRLIELGQLTEQEAAVHPQRNVLYRAIGQAEPFKPDIQTHQLPHPGYLLLCSDGLWGVVPEVEMFRIINTASNPSQACHSLVEAANNAGGPDNISVTLIQYLN